MNKRRAFKDDSIIDISTRRPVKAKFEQERKVPPLRPMTMRQAEYIEALKTAEQVVVMGPAGTGKTYIAGSWAADQLRQNKISKVIITRPNVPGGRSLGFFPGTLEEKIAPWVVPLTETIRERMGSGPYEIALKRGDIEIVPFEVMRGRSFKNAIVILDEAQNTTAEEMKMFLTRIGEGTQVIINGDVSQTDLKERSGLKTILGLIQSDTMPVPVVEFTIDDIVRSGICELWVRAFDKAKI
ncbi:PhoH family protein [Methylobacterium sp. WL120]|uniref:PhoH family protein n=1 Tax=Methylobacterium sp. WL120 TaxID=2603887 RepID=UPI0011CB6AF2|nr:PhoH family protein [Methylobacterium sp. WL120]TXM68181.1 PhoH family protein [Methylobacterium sp. WL120]